MLSSSSLSNPSSHLVVGVKQTPILATLTAQTKMQSFCNNIIIFFLSCIAFIIVRRIFYCQNNNRANCFTVKLFNSLNRNPFVVFLWFLIQPLSRNFFFLFLVENSQRVAVRRKLEALIHKQTAGSPRQRIERQREEKLCNDFKWNDFFLDRMTTVGVRCE